MLKEVQNFGQPLFLPLSSSETGLASLSGISISASTFDPRDPLQRPAGWAKLRTRRIIAKESVDRLNGTAEDTIVERREDRKREVGIKPILSLSSKEVRRRTS